MLRLLEHAELEIIAGGALDKPPESGPPPFSCDFACWGDLVDWFSSGIDIDTGANTITFNILDSSGYNLDLITHYDGTILDSQFDSAKLTLTVEF
jgi:hypothetical protein